MSGRETLWSEFLLYIERAAAANHPGVLFAGFRDELLARGLSKEEASEAIGAIVTMAANRRDWTAPMFDRIYRSPSPGFSTKPNALLVRSIANRSPGRALDIAMGQGRNALFLASLGWNVTGFDVSSEGVASTEEQAQRLGLDVEAHLAAHDEFDYGVARWDLIVMTYALVPVTDPGYAATLIASLRPQGLIVIESFAGERDRPPRPVEIDPDRLRDAYDRLGIITFEDLTDTPDWTDEPSRIVRMAAINR